MGWGPRKSDRLDAMMSTEVTYSRINLLHISKKPAASTTLGISGSHYPQRGILRVMGLDDAIANGFSFGRWDNGVGNPSGVIRNNYHLEIRLFQQRDSANFDKAAATLYTRINSYSRLGNVHVVFSPSVITTAYSRRLTEYSWAHDPAITVGGSPFSNVSSLAETSHREYIHSRSSL